MLAFCDYIAFRAQKFFGEITDKGDTYLKDVSKVEFDLSESGSFLSTKKTMVIADHSGKKYRLTVEEI